MTPIFPKIECGYDIVYDTLHPKGQTRIVVFTNVRKKYRGKWYLNRVEERFASDLTNEMDVQLINAVNSLNNKAYLFLLSGKVDTKAVGSMGIEIFPLDSDQREEKLRMEEINKITGIPVIVKTASGYNTLNTIK